MRVDRAFAFVDISGFTAYTSEHGDEDAIGVLSTFRNHLREVASQHAVRIDKWLGDGAMLVSVEIEPLLAAVVALEQRLIDSDCPLALRAGAAAGDVLLFEGDDYVGSVVNLAARLCDLAQSNQVLVPEALAEFAPRTAAVIPIGERDVRGFSGQVTLAVLSPVGSQGSAVPELLA